MQRGELYPAGNHKNALLLRIARTRLPDLIKLAPLHLIPNTLTLHNVCGFFVPTFSDSVDYRRIVPSPARPFRISQELPRSQIEESGPVVFPGNRSGHGIRVEASDP